MRKRFFFAMEMIAPWPEHYPEGRLLLESNRHLTLAFLGNETFSNLHSSLAHFPKPPFRIAIGGAFTKTLFLPKRSPHVASWHVQWWEKQTQLIQYRQTLSEWLQRLGFSIPQEFLSHVTIARNPSSQSDWEKTFVPLPCFAKDISLRASVGNSMYETYWNLGLAFPFSAIEHTADIAYIIRGESFEELYVHGWLALCFFETTLTPYFAPVSPSSLLDVIVALNARIAEADADCGSAIKAVSQHGVIRRKEEYMEWEMIADV